MTLTGAVNSLIELQSLVESGVWKNRPHLIHEIYSRFCELGQGVFSFGNDEFWDAVLHPSAIQEASAYEANETDLLIPDTLSHLQSFVESGIWRDNPSLRDRIFSRFLQLTRADRSSAFGTTEFWDAITSEDNKEDSAQAAVPSVGTGNVLAEDDASIDEAEFWNEILDAANGTSSYQEGHGDMEAQADPNLEIEAPEDAPIIDPLNYCELRPMFRKSSTRFGANYGQYDLTFKNTQDVADVEVLLLSVFTYVLEKIKQDGDDQDMLGFFLNHPMLDIPIIIPLRPQISLNAEMVVDEICKVLQSKKELTFDRKMTVFFTRIKRPSGSGKLLRRKYNTNLADYLKKKKAIIEIANRDDLCLARAIVTAIARIDNDRYQTVRKGDRDRNTLQRERATQLMEKAGLKDHKGSCGPQEWTAIQMAIGPDKYQLKIFDRDLFNAIVYEGPIQAPKVLHLWLCDNHFQVITSMTSFAETSYYCDNCNKGYSKKLDHRICPARCFACLAPGKCKLETPLRKCNACNRFFNNQACFDNHLRKGKWGVKLCDKLHRCESCRQEYETRKVHLCGVRQCRTCKLDVRSEEHQCFMQPYEKNLTEDDEDPLAEQQELSSDSEDEQLHEPGQKKRKKDQRTVFIFYDLECRQDEAISQNDNGDVNMHKPNLIIAHKVSQSRQSFLLIFYLSLLDTFRYAPTAMTNR